MCHQHRAHLIAAGTLRFFRRAPPFSGRALLNSTVFTRSGSKPIIRPMGSFEASWYPTGGFLLPAGRCCHFTPVKMGLARRPEDWPWSSLHDYAGNVNDLFGTPSGVSVDRILLTTDPRTLI